MGNVSKNDVTRHKEIEGTGMLAQNDWHGG
jgi:hypothetical protein